MRDHTFSMSMIIGVALLLHSARITASAQQAAQSLGVANAAGTATSAAPSIRAVWIGPSLTDADRARLSVVLARADTMSRDHRMADALRLNWSVVAEQRAAMEYPDVALRQLALVYFDLNDEYSVAAVFMELADAAAGFGDPTTQLRSLFDAALMYKRLGLNDRVGDCVRRIWPLLKSPAIPPTLRADIGARLVNR